MSRGCPVCERALERRPRPVGEVAEGAVGAVVEGAPVLTCPAGHHVEEVTADLRERLGAACAEALVASRRTRIRRRLACGACGAELTIPGRRTTRSVPVPVPDLGVVRVTFDLPMLRCPACGTEQLPAEVARDDLPAALSAALG